jgi:hypothetical protein
MSILNVGTVQASTISSSTGTTAFTIDSGGRVVSPTRPLFSGTDTRALDITAAVLTTANCFDQIDYNVGNCFNGATGRFTAPIAGYYDASVHFADTSATGKLVNVRIRKNGASNTGPLAEAYNQSTLGSTNVMVRCIVYLAVGDYIDFEAARLSTITAVQHKRFIIYLIG